MSWSVVSYNVSRPATFDVAIKRLQLLLELQLSMLDGQDVPA
jgi:hypothetical protein